MRQARFFAVFIFSGTLLVAQTQTSTACPAATTQSYTMLQSFNNEQGPNGSQPSGIIAQSRGGNMFSTAPDTWTGGEGTVFKITSSGTVTVLHSFSGTDGGESISGLTLGTGGHFWGTTAGGGLYGFGTIFKMTAGGALTTLHDFTGGADGGSALIASTCGPLMNVRGSSSSGLQPPHASATASAVAVAIDRALIRNPPGRPGSAAAASRPADETP